MRTTFIIIGLILMIVGIALFGYGLYTSLTLEKNTTGKYVDCYDKYDNKIIGEVCYDKGISELDVTYSKLMILVAFATLAVIVFMIGWEITKWGKIVL